MIYDLPSHARQVYDVTGYLQVNRYDLRAVERRGRGKGYCPAVHSHGEAGGIDGHDLDGDFRR